MRKLLSLLLVAAALVGAGGARADIGPPVQVRIMGEPRAAEPGVPFKGQFKIEVGQPLMLDDILLTGRGWRQVSLAVGPQLSVDKASPQIIDFEAVPSDANEPLEMTFSIDGYEVTRTFDLSPATIAFIRGPNPVEKVLDEADVLPLTEATAVKPEPTLSPNGAPVPQTAEKGRNIRVHGRFVYVRSDGYTIGADGMTVRVYDNDSPFPAAELAVVATDAQGYYDVTFYWGDDIFDPQPDIYVRFETTNSRIQTESPSFLSGPYAWETGTTNDYAGTDLNYGTLQPSDINQHPAVHIQTNLTRTWRWWYGYGYDTPFVRGTGPMAPPVPSTTARSTSAPVSNGMKMSPATSTVTIGWGPMLRVRRRCTATVSATPRRATAGTASGARRRRTSRSPRASPTGWAT